MIIVFFYFLFNLLFISSQLNIGALGMEIYEMFINELYFQGITVMNQIRKLFMIDMINPLTINTIDTKNFNTVILIFPANTNNENDKTEIPNIIREFLTIEKDTFKNLDLSIRDFMVKIFLTIERNSSKSGNVSEDDLNKIIRRFMQKKVENSNNPNIDYDDENVSHKEDEKLNTEFVENTNKCVRRLMKIIDFGLNKSYEAFLDDLNNILQPIRDSPTTNYGFGTFGIKNTPITSFRKYLKPSFETKKLLINEHEFIDEGVIQNDLDSFNLWDLYTTSFRDFYNKYFDHLNDLEEDSMDIKANKFKLRNKVYKDFKLKLCLVEDDKVFSSFLKQLINFEEKVLEKKDFLEDKDHDKDKEDDISFWRKFFNDISELEPNYKVYILPMNNPSDEKNQNPHLYYTSMLSEFLSNKDYIYQTLIFNPWMSHRENFEFTRYKELLSSTEKKYGFEQPNINDLITYLTLPLKLYITDADYVFKLNLYTIQNVEQFDNQYHKKNLFWRNATLKFADNSKKALKSSTPFKTELM